MRLHNQIKTVFIVCIILLAAGSCKKTDSGNTPNPEFPDYVTKVSSSVSGFVTNENDVPVAGAQVKCGTNFSITDRYGYFEFKNVQVVKEAATVVVNYPGYFKGIKTYMAAEGKAAFFRIKLLPKTIAGTFSASAGGTVSMPDGLRVSFPAGAVKNAASGAAYSGTITVSAKWIDPTSKELHKIMPGDLRGVNTNGELKGLQTYGMMIVELNGSSGETLQVADGKKVMLTFPLPSSLTATAPASIPLWYFDEEKGLWIEEGSAVKTGNTYVGEVSHFTPWNVDIPWPPPPTCFISCKVTNAAGAPLPNILVSFTMQTNGGGIAVYTDESGIASTWCFVNEDVLIEGVFEEDDCTESLFTRQIRTGINDETFSVGDIQLPVNQNVASVTGTVLDCDNNPLQSGYVMISKGKSFSRYSIAAGAYNFTIPLACHDSIAIILFAADAIAGKQSMYVSKYVINGQNAIAPLQVCAIGSEQYCDLRINNDVYGMTPTAPSVFNLSTITPDSAKNIANLRVTLVQNGIPVPSQTGEIQVLWYSYGSVPVPGGPHFLYSITPSLPVNNPQASAFILPRDYNINFKTLPINISEYGTVGEFVSGSFSGTLYETDGTGSIPERPYNVSCNFRLRRYQ